MTSGQRMKEAFDVESKHGAFYMGGNVEWHEDNLYCCTPTHISVLDITNGTVTSKIAEELEDTPDTIQTFTKTDEKLVTSHRSGLLKLWNLKGELEKSWKYIHNGPIARLNLREKVLASAGSDGVIRIWDLEHHVCTLALKGCQGVINVAEFHPTGNFMLASGDDGNIYLFELTKGKLQSVYTGHFSKVTSICFHHDNKHFISSGRDKVIILWNFEEETPLRTIPVSEVIESVVSLPNEFKLPNFRSKNEKGIFCATAGDRGVIRVWNVDSCKEIYVQQDLLVNKNKEEGGLAVTKLIYKKEFKSFAVVTAEQNIIIHDLKTFSCKKQFVGFSDEILDVIYLGENDAYIAVATNSVDIKLYENATMTCQLLKGHTDFVLALARSPKNPNLMISSGKDNSVRCWMLQEGIGVCIGVGTRHTASVSAISLSTKFAVSGSHDTCIKIWEIQENPEGVSGDKTILNCLHTAIGHQKEINSVAIAPNEKIIATASQDKTARLWSENLELLGTLKGHKRAVWCVKFSPVDQVVLTSSTDCTIKLWSISELNCLKTFEGHDASVFKIEFLCNGMQFLSVSGDSMLKLFSIKTSETIATYNEHNGRIWALAVKSDEKQVITAGDDSLLLKWKDVTEERREERIKLAEETVLEEQKLENYLQNDQLLKALKLALKLDRPFQVLKIIQSIIKKGEAGLAETVGELSTDYKEQLFRIASNWNTNSKHCQPAQLVLNVLLNELQSGDFRPEGLSSILEGALPYTERHFKRLTQLMQDLQFINYTINCIQPHAKC